MDKMLCRSCMSANAALTVSLFDETMQLAKKLMEIASIKISQRESLPKSICYPCLDKLNAAYDFKTLCEKSDLLLRHSLTVKNVCDQTESRAHETLMKQTNRNERLQQKLEVYTEQKIITNNIAVLRKNLQVAQQLIKNNTKSDLENATNVKISPESNIKPSTVFNSNYNNMKLVIKPKQKKKNRLAKYMCETCGRIFNDKSSLIIHTRYHTGDKPFICHFCNKGFAVEINLKTHIRCHSGEKPYVCDVCGHGFSVLASLLGHIRSHTGEKPFQCSTCQKSFTQRSNLRTHIRIHTGNKPHKCSTCGKNFSTTSDLTQHVRSHTGEKPYACHLCPKRFSMSSNLKIHIKTHSGEKNFKCSLCNKSYICKASLNSHMRVHTGIKAYTCSECGKCFAHSSTLTAHLVVHTGARDYECEFCHKKFARSSSLSMHKKKHAHDKVATEKKKIEIR